jgi:hypothetical protein
MQQFTPPGFWHFFVIIGAMQTTVAAALSPFQMKNAGKHHQAFFIKVKVNVLNQFLTH